MLEIPSYIKLVVDNTSKVERTRSSGRAPQAKPTATTSQASGNVNNSGDVVYLVSRENQRASTSHLPTPAEAQEAMERLQRDLPHLTGDDLGKVHSNLDRRRILQLLAPLVES